MDANSIEKQLAQLKAEHQKAMAELQGIKKLALEEKAPKTAAALDKLIASAEQNFQKEIAPLQQRLDRMKGVKKQGEEGKKGAGKRTGGKKTK